MTPIWLCWYWKRFHTAQSCIPNEANHAKCKWVHHYSIPKQRSATTDEIALWALAKDLRAEKRLSS